MRDSFLYICTDLPSPFYYHKTPNAKIVIISISDAISNP
jgi:hypothetical protein